MGFDCPIFATLAASEFPKQFPFGSEGNFVCEIWSDRYAHVASNQTKVKDCYSISCIFFLDYLFEPPPPPLPSINGFYQGQFVLLEFHFKEKCPKFLKVMHKFNVFFKKTYFLAMLQVQFFVQLVSQRTNE